MSVCFTWRVCWGCWDPRLHSDLVSCYHHVVGFESHNEAYDFLLGWLKIVFKVNQKHFISQSIMGNKNRKVSYLNWRPADQRTNREVS